MKGRTIKVKTMTKQTNEFQQLIHAIELQLNDNAIVTESKFLPDWATGDEREADIVIETEAGPRSMKIIECRDHARRRNIEWIDQMYGKHARMTHQLVLVSKSGFTVKAKRKAEALGIEALTFGEAKKVDWAQIVGKLTRVYIALSQGQPTRIIIIPKLDTSADIGSLQLYGPDGTLQGSPLDVGHHILGTPYVLNYIFTTFQQPGDYSFYVDFDPVEGSYLKDKSGTSYSLKKLLFSMSIHLDKRVPVDLQHGSYRDAQVAYGTLEHPEVRGLLTIVETSGKPLSADLALKEK
jgi:hypothetical protein